ncbi:MAG: GtrA family protein [Selenomonadales bacterium]|nr:GtrA family protein [Selenomonadales bacterium]MDY3740568.1 GtrA family protein [Selenomonadaceae bacterium]MEE1360968.1 GtrA family protein [Selenomonadaceae bacterium]
MDLKKLMPQIIKFGVVGGTAFFIDYGLLLFFTDICGIWYLLSSFLSYSISTVFNYWASMKFVFKGKEDMGKGKEFTIFVTLSLMGLGVNQVGMWGFVDGFGMDYKWAKIIVTAIVMVWNFITRKIFLEEKSH